MHLSFHPRTEITKTEIKCLYYAKQVSSIYIPFPEKSCCVRQTRGEKKSIVVSYEYYMLPFSKIETVHLMITGIIVIEYVWGGANTSPLVHFGNRMLDKIAVIYELSVVNYYTNVFKIFTEDNSSLICSLHIILASGTMFTSCIWN